ncbi:MAG: single-stranded-DNA-specific exonuclease RecJ [Thermoleophilia bacterium]
MRLARWYTSPLPFSESKELAESLGVSEIMASVLLRRGFDDPDEARRYLDPEGKLHDPFLFNQMADVCSRINNAIAVGENICIHGDYDVDGITSTCLLQNILQQMGARVSHHLPNRFTEGYGVALKTVEKIAAAGTSLLIAVDCGITANKEIERARVLGMETIVIDHHRPPADGVPPAMIISPQICDYPYKDLAGVGLAFKVAQALLGFSDNDGEELPRELRDVLDLVALGTIADVVPLTGENRSLVQRGLIQMSRCNRPGLRALMKVGQIEPLKLSAGMVSFRLAPRINAAGRLKDPELALELLLAEDDGTATRLAGELDSLNQERQRIENKMLASAQEMVSGWPNEEQDSKAYVLSSPGWHEGVIGIVASRMAELHHRPVFMIAEGDKVGKGSGRSVPSFNLHSALEELSHLLVMYGGHKAACGLTIKLDQIDRFRSEFSRYAGQNIADEAPERLRRVDALVAGRELNLKLAQELSLMEPFGMGNPSIDLLVTGVQLKSGRVTKNGLHLQCQIDCGGVRSGAIGFNQGFMLEQVKSHPEWDVVFRLEQNEFNGSVSPQLNLRELMPRSRETARAEGLCSFGCDWDCPQRVRDDEFWSLFLEHDSHPEAFLERLGKNFLDSGKSDSLDLNERLVDRRGFGSIPSQITRLLTTGQRVLLISADVARRRSLVSYDLPFINLNLDNIFLASTRCGQSALRGRFDTAAVEGNSLVLADLVTSLSGKLDDGFEHVVFLDPPPNEDLLHAVGTTFPHAWLHLIYSSDEVQFTGKVLAHEFDLRSPLIKIYQRLQAVNIHPLDETTERLLLAGGKYLRQPALAARCLQVLQELGLIVLEKRDGKPILTLPKMEKTELTRSATYQAAQLFNERCQKFLNKSLDARLT